MSWVFGIQGENFVKTILRLAREREELRVVADQHGCPTYAGDIADTLLELAGRATEIDADSAWGVYHYCGEPATTWHGFANAIVERARVHEKLNVRAVTAIATVRLPNSSRLGPANSVLDCTRLATRFDIHPASWREGLTTMLFASPWPLISANCWSSTRNWPMPICNALERVRDSTGEGLDTLLVKLGLVSERDLAEAVAAQLNLPLVRPGDYPEMPATNGGISSRFLKDVARHPAVRGRAGTGGRDGQSYR
ncbi:MAG: sugar nucleotide-binding protein [Comamonadaceae bacterium]|nr:sugar nucleotide-binding protein [Comamonadaceae bacterium]